MFNNIAFDVVIGLIFVYLLYSLLATILQEILAHILNLRSRMLNKAIRRMLEDEVVKYDPWWEKISILTWFYSMGSSLGRFFRPYLKNETFVQLFYAQPAIKYLGESKHSNKPSYLDSKNFSSTLVQLLRGPDYDGSQQNEAKLIKETLDNNAIKIAEPFEQRILKGKSEKTIKIPPETLTQLRVLFHDSRQDSFLFRKRLEDWFEETMDRASGWYKKQTQVLLFLLGLGLAIAFNVNTIQIYKVLSKDKEARQQIVNMAIQKDTELQKAVQTSKDGQPPDDAILYNTYKDVKGDADKANQILGLGSKHDAGLLSVVGILLTALAISLGSPFWFDLLNKFIQMRGTGPKPAPSTDKSTGNAPGGGKMPVTTPDGKPIRG